MGKSNCFQHNLFCIELRNLRVKINKYNGISESEGQNPVLQ
jgi:hypothetical protein